jgi:hypothetical protein
MSQSEQKVWQIPLSKKPRIECEEVWFHSAISIATDDCIDFVNIEKKARVEMDDDELEPYDEGDITPPGVGITINSSTITGTITGAVFSVPKKYTLTIEVTAKSAADAVALVQDFAKNIRVEEIPQNYYGIQNL